MTTEVSKGRVLEVFLSQYRKSDGEDPRRALMAYNATLDQLAPWKRDRSPEEELLMKIVVEYLQEILLDDYGISLKLGQKLTPKQDEGTRAGIPIAEEWLKTGRDQLRPFPHDFEGARAWYQEIHGIALPFVPAERLADKEWTTGFIGGFTGILKKYVMQKGE